MTVRGFPDYEEPAVLLGKLITNKMGTRPFLELSAVRDPELYARMRREVKRGDEIRVTTVHDPEGGPCHNYVTAFEKIAAADAAE